MLTDNDYSLQAFSYICIRLPTIGGETCAIVTRELASDLCAFPGQSRDVLDLGCGIRGILFVISFVSILVNRTLFLTLETIHFTTVKQVPTHTILRMPVAMPWPSKVFEVLPTPQFGVNMTTCH